MCGHWHGVCVYPLRNQLVDPKIMGIKIFIYATSCKCQSFSYVYACPTQHHGSSVVTSLHHQQLHISLTSRGLGSDRLVRYQGLTRPLHVLCLHPELILSPLQEARHRGTSLLWIHPVDGWHPASTVGDISLLNDIPTEEESMVQCRWLTIGAVLSCTNAAVMDYK